MAVTDELRYPRPVIDAVIGIVLDECGPTERHTRWIDQAHMAEKVIDAVLAHPIA